MFSWIWIHMHTKCELKVNSALIKKTGKKETLSIWFLGITYFLFLLSPLQFFAHDLNDTWQSLVCSLHVQKAQSSSARNHIDGCTCVLLYSVLHLNQTENITFIRLTETVWKTNRRLCIFRLTEKLVIFSNMKFSFQPSSESHFFK